jgi:hypothetical protein
LNTKLQENNDKQRQGTQQCPKEHSQGRNVACNHWEFHSVVTRHDQTKFIRGTQEIPRHQKYRTQEDTETSNKPQSKTENNINREINKLKTKIYNIKEEVTHDIENFRNIMKQKHKHSGKPLQQTRTSRK